MFHFTGFAERAYFSFDANSHGFTMGGTPIQRSPDQSLLSGSPKLIAASHVLHRFQLPRCPPFALTSLMRHTLYSLVKDLRNQLCCAFVDRNTTPAESQHSAFGAACWTKDYPVH